MNLNFLESDVLQNIRKTVLATSIGVKTLFEYTSFFLMLACALRCYTAVCTVSCVESILRPVETEVTGYGLLRGTKNIVLSFCRCYCKGQRSCFSVLKLRKDTMRYSERDT